MIQKLAPYPKFALPVTLAAIALSFFFLALWTPLMQDDLVFMAQAADLSRIDDPSAVPGFSVDAWLGHIKLMYLENNGRLANILAPVGAWLLPQWLRALLIGLCAAWIFYMVAAIASDGRPRWRGVLALWALSLVAWPWRDRLMFWDYALNYLFASALLLPFLYLFCKKRLSDGLVAVGALCGFFGAWIHDGSAVCMAAVVFFLALMRRFRLSRGQWVMAVALLLGSVAVLASPGEWQRASGEVGSVSLRRNLLVSLRIEPLVWLLFLLLGYLAVFRRDLLRKFLGDELLLGTALMALFSFLMSVVLDPSGRYGWQAEVFVSAALLGLWNLAGLRLSPALKTTLAAVSALFAGIVMVSAVLFQHRLWVENGEILSEAEFSPTGTVFRDVLSIEDEPITALRLPATGVWANSFQMACANALRSSRGRMVAVVPERFRDFSVDSLRMLEGDTGVGVYGEYLVGTDTVAPFDEPGFLCGAQRTAVRTLLLTDSAGVSTPDTFWLYKFRVPRSGGRAVVLWGPVKDGVRGASLPR